MAQQEFEEWAGILLPVIPVGTVVRFTNHYEELYGEVAAFTLFDDGSCLYEITYTWRQGEECRAGAVTRNDIEPVPLDSIDAIQHFLDRKMP